MTGEKELKKFSDLLRFLTLADIVVLFTGRLQRLIKIFQNVFDILGPD